MMRGPTFPPMRGPLNVPRNAGPPFSRPNFDPNYGPNGNRFGGPPMRGHMNMGPPNMTRPGNINYNHNALSKVGVNPNMRGIGMGHQPSNNMGPPVMPGMVC